MTKRQLLNTIIKESISFIDFDYMDYFIAYDITIFNSFVVLHTQLWKNENSLISDSGKSCYISLKLDKEEAKKKIQEFYSLIYKTYINLVDYNKQI